VGPLWNRKFKTLIYSVMPIQWTFLDDRFQKYVHCTGIIFDFQGILLKIAFFCGVVDNYGYKAKLPEFSIEVFTPSPQKVVDHSSPFTEDCT
jgi:hypothetical protein